MYAQDNAEYFSTHRRYQPLVHEQLCLTMHRLGAAVLAAPHVVLHLRHLSTQSIYQ